MNSTEKAEKMGNMSAEEFLQLHSFDKSKIYVYTKDDFLRIIRDFEETQKIVGTLMFYLDPVSQESFGRDELFQKLCELRPFSEALRRIQEDQKKIPELAPDRIRKLINSQGKCLVIVIYPIRGASTIPSWVSSDT